MKVMAGVNTIKLKSLKQTKNYYLEELKKDLTEKEKDSYLLALKTIKKIISQKELSGEKKDRQKSLIKGVIT